MYLTVAEQIFMLKEKIKKRTHFLLKDVYDCEIFKAYSKDDVNGTNQYLYLPKAGLNNQNCSSAFDWLSLWFPTRFN